MEEEDFDHTEYLRKQIFDVISSLNLIEPVFTKHTYNQLQRQLSKLDEIVGYLGNIVNCSDT